MATPAITTSKRNSTSVWMLKPGEIAGHKQLSSSAKAWAKANGFDGQNGKLLLVPDQKGGVQACLFGTGNQFSSLEAGSLASRLPKGSYHLEGKHKDAHHLALGWALGSYKFTQYKSSKAGEAKLIIPDGVDRKQLQREADAAFLARDLINTPANDLGPDDLEKAVRNLAKSHKASVSVIKGDALLKKNFPLIHTVGRASIDAPRLIDLKWGKSSHPKITLVGKGVIFDSGGLNIKPGNSMALMKKDMGGAANVIALAHMIMDATLPVRLRLLVPAVENAISGNAFRPGDILPSRKGISVEIGNTDAEGRLILADALALGDEEKPEMMIDMATLTGAARVALGPDLPPFYTHDDKFANALAKSADARYDPLWRMPLWSPYKKMLNSPIADINHISSGGFAGSITAALFLERFVEKAKSWTHLDVYGWNPSTKPWAPIGGEAQGIRALFDVISKRYPR